MTTRFPRLERHEAHNRVLVDYVKAVEDGTARVDRLTKDIVDLVENWSMRPLVKALQALRGVQLITAVILAAGDLTAEARTESPPTGAELGKPRVRKPAASLRRIDTPTQVRDLEPAPHGPTDHEALRTPTKRSPYLPLADLTGDGRPDVAFDLGEGEGLLVRAGNGNGFDDPIRDLVPFGPVLHEGSRAGLFTSADKTGVWYPCP